MSATTFNATVFMNRAFEKAAKASATDFSLACIHALAEHYGFDAQEAVNRLGIDQVTVKKSATRKKGEGKVKVQKTKAEPKPKREVPEFPLPWTGSAVVGWCNGLRLNHGLHSQCCMEPIEGGEYCKTCQKQADKNASGKPTYGCVADRMACGLLEYRDPKAGKQTIPFANVMAKLSITREAAEAEATKFGLTIPEEHFVERAARRGRPKKDASASDSDSETSSTSSKQAKKRGRPKKEKKVIAASVGDDLIAQLVAQASTSNTVIASAEDDVSSISSAESESKPIKKVVKKVKKTTVESASDSSDSEAEGDLVRGSKSSRQKPHMETEVDVLLNVDYVPSNLPLPSGRAKLEVMEDNEAVIKMTIKGRSAAMRHVPRTHRIDLDWLFERFLYDEGCFMKYCPTRFQVADLLTKGSFNI